jgi:hypothetical protein
MEILSIPVKTAKYATPYGSSERTKWVSGCEASLCTIMVASATIVPFMIVVLPLQHMYGCSFAHIGINTSDSERLCSFALLYYTTGASVAVGHQDSKQ